MADALAALRHLAALGGPVLWVIAAAGVVSWAVIFDLMLAAALRKRSMAAPLWLLRALAMVAPLLGLLGTVSGIIACFSDLSTSNGRHLAGGIAEALVCTAAGLVVAIPAIVAHAYFARHGQVGDVAAIAADARAPAPAAGEGR